MNITYLGTAAAEGIPAVFCNCETCAAARRIGGRAVRSRAQVLIDGDLSVDFPPEAFSHAARFHADFSAIRYLFVTHSHFDHFFASELCMRGYAYAHALTSLDLHLYANEEVLSVFHETTAREMRPDVAEHIFLHPIHAFERIEAGDYTVIPLPARHNTREPLCFLFEKGGKRVLHLCDTAVPAESDLAPVRGMRCDLVTLDCTHLFAPTRPSNRHMSLEGNMRCLELLASLGIADGATKRVITHFSHNSAPSEEALSRAEREYGVIAAYDGLTVTV